MVVALYVVFIVGMAGSGKSVLTGSLCEWLRRKDQNAISLNLDPGAISLPYNPDVDVRSYVDILDLMETHQLGPNSALLMAVDLIGDYIEEIKQEIEEVEPDLLLVDTPGQMELFAFRESGPFISSAITKDPEILLYLFDAPFCRNPLNFVSNMFLAAAIHSRLLKPQVYALTKTDLIGNSELDSIIAWSEETEQLEYAIQNQLGKNLSLISRDLVHAISRVGLIFEPIPVSAKGGVGFVELYAALTRILTGGEELAP